MPVARTGPSPPLYGPDWAYVYYYFSNFFAPSREASVPLARPGPSPPLYGPDSAYVYYYVSNFFAQVEQHPRL